MGSGKRPGFIMQESHPLPQIVPPNPAYIEMLRTVLAQNELILKMNADLVKQLGNPMLSIMQYREKSD